MSRRIFGTSSIAILLLAATSALAQDVPDAIKILVNGQPVEQKGEGLPAQAVPEAIKPGDYWLGVQVGLPGDELRSKLKLPEEQGLIVESVVHDSPAAKGQIKTHDVLMKAGDNPLKQVQDLIDAVQNAKDKELSVTLLRDGKEEKVTVTPAKRPLGLVPGMPAPLPGNADWDKIHKWLEQVYPEGMEGEAKDGQPWRFRIFRPGAIMPHDVLKFVELPTLPDDMTVTVVKTGKKAAEVVVKQGDEEWKATEEDLSKLPEKARPYVERMLGRTPFSVRILQSGPDMALPAPPPGVVVPHPPAPRLEKQLDEMSQRIEKLDKMIQELRDNQAKQSK